jgi:hypothetical protein
MSDSEYPPLGTNVLVSPRMVDAIGSELMTEIVDSLRRGDCQTCGASIVSGPVSIYAEVFLVLAHISLHHPTCQSPAWNDGGRDSIIHGKKTLGAHTTYVTSGVVFDNSIPALIVHPSIELAHIRTDSSKQWRLTTIESYLAYHHMLPGGPTPASPSQPAIGVQSQFGERSITIDFGAIKWIAEPGSIVIAKAKEAGGILLAVSTLYSGGDLSFDEAMMIVSDPRRTAQAWVPDHLAPAPGTPASEYLIYRNDNYSAVGLVVDRNADIPMELNQAEAWMKNRLESIEDIDPDHLVEGPSWGLDESAIWVWDAISVNMYFAVKSEDGWRIVRSFSRYGGDIPPEDVEEWANAVMVSKSPHRIPVNWQRGPRAQIGTILIAHVMPTEK